MIDKIMAIFALLGLTAFVATVPIYVPHIDLIIFSALCVALAAYDFWRELFRRKR